MKVTYVMRTLSARILLGFTALTITFGVIVGNFVWNLREVEDEASLILRGYVPLALASGDLVRRQDELKNYLDQGVPHAIRAGDVRNTIATLRGLRQKALDQIVSRIESFPALVETNGDAATEGSQQFASTRPIVESLEKAIADVSALYDTVLLAPPTSVPNKSDPEFAAIYAALDPAHKAAFDALEQIREEERKIARSANNLRENYSRRTTLTKDWLATNERTVRIRAIYLGISAVLLGLFVTIWVVITLRPLRRLTEAARRIAAGDYKSLIPETGPTEIAGLAREFNSMGRAVQQREEEKLRAARLAMVGKMAAQIAHEVRNPLSSIGLNTELLEDELGVNATEARELCRSIHREVNRLTEVTETYLGLRGGKPRLARESLNTIIGDLVGFVHKDLESKQVKLATELASDDPSGYIDANQIRQCLINLVRNAADAVAAKGGGHVTLRTGRDAGWVVIEVQDDGIGIAPDLLPRLFDPFFSTKEGGSGLGLALTQQIIRDHGGDVRVASTVGRGTTFTVSVPSAA